MMQEFDMDAEVERYIDDQLARIGGMLSEGVENWDEYNRFVGHVRAYRDVKAHIVDLRSRRARVENEEEETTHEISG